MWQQMGHLHSRFGLSDERIKKNIPKPDLHREAQANYP